MYDQASPGSSSLIISCISGSCGGRSPHTSTAWWDQGSGTAPAEQSSPSLTAWTRPWRPERSIIMFWFWWFWWKSLHAANVALHLIHNFSTYLPRPGAGGKALRSRSPVEVESDSHGWKCLNLLRPCAQPKHNSRAPVQNPSSDNNLNVDRVKFRQTTGCRGILNPLSQISWDVQIQIQFKGS